MESSSRVERTLATALRPFAKVEPGEAITALVMTFAAFLLLTAYYLLKTVREPLILLEGGAEVKLYARAGQAVLMVGVTYLYGELARRVGRLKLLAIVFLFFTSNLVVFIFLVLAKVQIGLAFFLWVGLFSYTSVAQYWALAADLYSDEQGKRLFPILGIGSSVGAVAGARLAKSLVPLGTAALMIGAAILVVLCVAILAWVEYRVTRGQAAKKAAPAAGDDGKNDAKDAKGSKGAKDDEKPLSNESVVRLLMRDRYLVLTAIMIILLNWVNSAGEFIFDRTILQAVSAAQTNGQSPEVYVGAVKADYFAWYNLLGMVLQLFAVSRIIAKAGVRNSLLVLPICALFGYGAGVALPVMATLRLVKIGENTLEYSIAETARHTLFLVTSRVEKYVGKTAVDTVAVRLGAVMSAAVVFIGDRAHLPLAAFSAINVALCVGWIAVVFAIGKEHARRSKDTPEQLEEEPQAPVQAGGGPQPQPQRA